MPDSESTTLTGFAKCASPRGPAFVPASAQPESGATFSVSGASVHGPGGAAISGLVASVPASGSFGALYAHPATSASTYHRDSSCQVYQGSMPSRAKRPTTTSSATAGALYQPGSPSR